MNSKYNYPEIITWLEQKAKQDYGEKAFANDIAFIEIGQWEGDDENQIELYNLKYYIDIEMRN